MKDYELEINLYQMGYFNLYLSLYFSLWFIENSKKLDEIRFISNIRDYFANFRDISVNYYILPTDKDIIELISQKSNLISKNKIIINLGLTDGYNIENFENKIIYYPYINRAPFWGYAREDLILTKLNNTLKNLIYNFNLNTNYIFEFLFEKKLIKKVYSYPEGSTLFRYLKEVIGIGEKSIIQYQASEKNICQENILTLDEVINKIFETNEIHVLFSADPLLHYDFNKDNKNKLITVFFSYSNYFNFTSIITPKKNKEKKINNVIGRFIELLNKSIEIFYKKNLLITYKKFQKYYFKKKYNNLSKMETQIKEKEIFECDILRHLRLYTFDIIQTAKEWENHFIRFQDSLLKFFVKHNKEVTQENFLDVLDSDTLNIINEYTGIPIITDIKRNLGKTFGKIYYNLKLKSIYLAIALIMARNLSHNIGSHVLSNLSLTANKENFNEIKKFYKYLLERMNFIAHITTEHSKWTYSAWLIREILMNFLDQKLLLNYLNSSEGLEFFKLNCQYDKREFRKKLIIRILIEKNNNLFWMIDEYKCFNETENNCCYKNKNQCKRIIEYKRKYGSFQDDIQIAIPAGNIGFHALYVIIEGILRNEAKHNYSKRIKYEKEKGLIYFITNNRIFFKKNKIYKKIKFLMSDERIENSQWKVILIDNNKIKIEEFLKKNNIPQEKYKRIFILWNEKRKIPDIPKEFQGINFLTKVESEKIIYYINEKLEDDLENYLSDVPLKFNIKISEDKKLKDIVWITIWAEIPHLEKIILINKNQIKIFKFVGLQIKKEIISNINLFKKEDIFIIKNSIKDKYSNKEFKKIIIDDEIFDKIWNINNTHEFCIKLFSINKFIKEYFPLWVLLNSYFEEPFIDKKGDILKSNWGLSEIKISAYYLQIRDDFNIFEKNINFFNGEKNITNIENLKSDYFRRKIPIGIIKAIPVDKNGNIIRDTKANDFYYLGFKFWVYRPLEMLMVTNNEIIKR